MSFINITSEWTLKIAEGKVYLKKEFSKDGIIYKVDNKRVFIKLNSNEIKIANILAKTYGKTVEIIPCVTFPQGIQTPDYLIDGEYFDLKTPTGGSKNLFYNILSKKKKQSQNFIIDITYCQIGTQEAFSQAQKLYLSRHTRFIDKLVIIKNGKIVCVYAKN